MNFSGVKKLSEKDPTTPVDQSSVRITERSNRSAKIRSFSTKAHGLFLLLFL